MSQFTVVKGTKYKAKLKLGWAESFAGNDLVAQRLIDAGFDDVKVEGEDYDRVAYGTWNKDDATGDMPEEIVEIEVVT